MDQSGFEVEIIAAPTSFVSDEGVAQGGGNDYIDLATTASDQDDAAITTLPVDVLGPTPTPSPTPVASPAVLPPTGGLGALAEDGFAVILFALLGLGLVVGGAWIIWSSRRWDNRRGSRS